MRALTTKSSNRLGPWLFLPAALVALASAASPAHAYCMFKGPQSGVSVPGQALVKVLGPTGTTCRVEWFDAAAGQVKPAVVDTVQLVDPDDQSRSCACVASTKQCVAKADITKSVTLSPSETVSATLKKDAEATVLDCAGDSCSVLMPISGGRQAPVQVPLVQLGLASNPAAACAPKLIGRPVPSAMPLVVMQYNILAKYLGSNFEPWFLYGGDLGTPTKAAAREEQGKRVNAIANERTPDGKAWKNPSFAKWLETCVTFTDSSATVADKEGCGVYKDVFTTAELAAIRNYELAHFNWEARKPKLLKQLTDGRADIISLVELDEASKAEGVSVPLFASELRDLGYDHVFVKRPRASSADGCGVFFKRDRFTLVKHEGVVYDDNDRIAILVMLTDRLTQRSVVVVSTHLMREPDVERQEAVRVLEIAKLGTAIAAFAADDRIPVIVAGDFNAVPTGAAFAKMKELGFKTTVYKESFATSEAEECTSKTLQRNVWIDYVWFRGVGRIADPPMAVADCRGGAEKVWPNAAEGSDHVPIIGKLFY